MSTTERMRFLVTTDVLLKYKDHFLAIRRKYPPNQGMYALPGGHVDAHERIPDAALRELEEETGFVPGVKLADKLKFVSFFDDPNRDPRGRYIGFLYLLDVTEYYPTMDSLLQELKAGDDADAIKMVSFVDVMNGDVELAFDHEQMIGTHILGLQ